MTLTTEDKLVLKALVEKELTDIRKDEKNFKVVNSPVLSSIVRTRENDFPFLRSAKLYEKYLEALLKKL